MTWVLILYGAVGYWYFWQILRHLEGWDDGGTVVLNVVLALLFGPVLLAAVPLIWMGEAIWPH